MIYGSVCSGIEAASVAWEPLGWKAAWYSEIEAFPSAVLSYRFPDVPNLGDMTQIHESEVFRRAPIDLLVGGTPCQAFSVAGLRRGLADPRGNLALVYLRLAALSGARWLVWENVPGVLSSNGGRDFGAFLGALEELGYGWAYRVLDAQYFGVPQRRRRVFVVAYLGDWRPPAAVLFEPESLRGDPPPRRQAWPGAAPAAPAGPGGGGEVAGALLASTAGSGYRVGADEAAAGHIVAAQCHGGNVGPMGTLRSGHGDVQRGVPFVAHTLRGEGFDASEDGTGRGIPLVAGTLMANSSGHRGRLTADQAAAGHLVPVDDAENSVARAFNARATQRLDASVETFIAFDSTQISHPENRSNPQPGDPCHTLPAHGAPPTVVGVTLHGNDQTVSTASFSDVSTTLRARTPGKVEGSSTTVVLHGDQAPVAFYSTESHSSGNNFDISPTLRVGTSGTGGEPPAIAFQERGRPGGRSLEVGGDVAYALLAPNEGGRAQERNIATASAVRRLTPIECERLQGFPDNWTLIPFGFNRAKDIAEWLEYLRLRDAGLTAAEAMRLAADGPRYKACGNSMAVPCMEWIGQRIDVVDRLILASSLA